MGVRMHKLNPDMSTAIIIFVYILIAIVVVIIISVALLFWGLVDKYIEHRKKKGLR